MNRPSRPGYIAFLITGFAILIAFPSSSSPGQFSCFGPGEGLPGFRVYDILEDDHGFLWFATMNGLSRFDGAEFVTFSHVDTALHSLSGNVVTALGRGPEGEIIAGTVDGALNIQSGFAGFFSRYSFSEGTTGEPSRMMIRQIFSSTAGDLFVATLGKGLFRFAVNGSEMQQVEHFSTSDGPGSILDNVVYGLCEDSLRNIWVGTSRGLQVWEQDHHRFTDIGFGDRAIDGLLRRGVTALARDRDATLWIGTTSGIIELPYPYDIPRICTIGGPTGREPFVTDLLPLEEEVWIGSQSGLIRYERGTGKVVTFLHISSDPGSLPDNLIYRVGSDRSGNIWVCTDQGIGKYPTLARQFRLVEITPDVWVTAIFEDSDGSLWVGTEDGLSEYTRQERGALNRVSGSGSLLKGKNISSIAGSTDGAVFVATRDGELFSLAPGREGPALSPAGGAFPEITSLSAGPSSLLWVGTSGSGLLTYDLKTGTTTQASARIEAFRGFEETWITALFSGSEGDLWVGTEGQGLIRVKGTNRAGPALADGARVEVFVHDAADSTSLSSDRIYALHRGRTGSLWVATGTGLDRMDTGSGVVQRMLISGSRFFGTIMSIQEDERGLLWLSTLENGIYSFDPGTRRLRSYSSEEGLPGNRFWGASCRCGDNELMFGSFSGIICFRPARVPSEYNAAGLMLTEFRVLDRPVPLSASAKGGVSLGYIENFISFGVSAPGYPSQDRAQIMYTLEGSDRKWFPLGRNRTATYRPLEPGSYIFRAKSFHPINGAYDQELSLPIVIAPPFWETWWFRGILLAILVALAFAVHRYRLSKALALERMRGQIASDLHDDIGSSLGSIALSCDVMKGHPDLTESDIAQLGKISRIARDTAEHLRDIVWVINPTNDSLETFLLQLKHQASVLLQGIQWTGEFRSPSEDRRLEMQFRHHAYLIFKEVLHNIVKHSGASEAAILVYAEDGHLRMEVSDNGVGFDAAAANGGMGLRSLRERATRIGGKLNVRTECGKGTRIELLAKIT